MSRARGRLAVKPALVMIDCDGTMFDSHEANRAFYDAVLDRIGAPPLEPAQHDWAHRLATPQLFERLFADDPDGYARAIEAARATDYAPFLLQMEPMPELVETLTWVHERYRTALVTNRGGTIPRLLEHFALAAHFDLVVGVHDVARPKPAPDMLVRCLDHFAVPPAHAIYVGDSPGDGEASRAAGVAFVAVGENAEGDCQLDSFAELRDLLG